MHQKHRLLALRRALPAATASAATAIPPTCPPDRPGHAQLHRPGRLRPDLCPESGRARFTFRTGKADARERVEKLVETTIDPSLRGSIDWKVDRWSPHGTSKSATVSLFPGEVASHLVPQRV